MIYFKLENTIIKASWKRCEFDKTKRQVKLYDFINGLMVIKGIGLY